MKTPLILTAALFSGLYFALSSFTYLNLDTFAPLANAEGTLSSIGIALAVGVGVIQFPTVIAISIALLLEKD
jgi:hypothetical protein